MIKFKNIVVLVIGVMLLASCSDDNFTPALQPSDSAVNKAPNVVAFVNASQSTMEIANGDVYDVSVPLTVQGPTLSKLDGDITVTIGVDFTGIDAALKAKDGVNFKLATSTVTLKKSQNYLGAYTFQMLTAGIDPISLVGSPQLNLVILSVAGAKNVIGTGKSLPVTLNYACDSNLQGNYSLTIVRGDGKVGTNPSETVEKIGIGAYYTQSVEYFFPGGSRGDYLAKGVKFTDVCNVLSVPAQNLGDTYSNQVYEYQKGTVEYDGAGNLKGFTLYYTVEFGSGNQDHVATYTKK